MASPIGCSVADCVLPRRPTFKARESEGAGSLVVTYYRWFKKTFGMSFDITVSMLTIGVSP